jgi:hypothetical protein
MHVIDTPEESDDEFYIGSVDVGSISDREWYEAVKVKNTSVKFQLDAGAKCNVISSTMLQKIDSSAKVIPKSTLLKSFSRHYIRTLYWHCLFILCVEKCDTA